MFNWDFEVHKEPLYKRYYVKPSSASFLMALIAGFILIGMSMFISYNSWGTPFNNGGFWLKESIKYEQPVVEYRQQAIVELHGKDVNGGPFNIYYSTSSGLNRQHSSSLRMGMIQSASMDDNQDSIPDRLEFVITMPLRTGEKILGMQMIVMNDVRLRQNAKVIFDSATYFQYEAGAAAVNSVRLGGDLIVEQTESLSVGGKYKAPYNNQPLLDKIIAAGDDASLTSMDHILAQAAARSISTSFMSTYTTSVRSTEQELLLDNTIPRIFNATISLRIPHQPIRITPAIAEVLKIAWMQYMTFFFTIGFLLYCFMSFVLSQNLMEGNLIADVIMEKTD